MTVLITIPGARGFAQSATSTTLVVSPTSLSNGSVVILTATVKAGGTSLAGGTVTFRDTYNRITQVLGTVQVQSSPVASVGTAALAKQLGGIGTHAVVAVFNATSAYAASPSATQNVTVTGLYPTTASLIQTGGSAGNYSLAATITGLGSTSAFPTGNMTLQDTSNSNLLLQTAGLVAGTKGRQTIAGSTSPVGVGSNPVGAATGDFNHDGFIDLAVLNSGSNTVSILLGNGSGGFTAATKTYATNTNAVGIVTADFNGDGKLDLAVADNSGQVGIFLGNGDGTFKAQVDYILPYNFLIVYTTPTALAVGDFNGDGIPDLAVAGVYIGGVVDIMLGDGTGAFPYQQITQIGVGSVPASVVVGDFNKDGHLDFAVADYNSNAIDVMLGNGSGTNFVAATNSPISLGKGASPASIVTADFDGDGNPDLAVAEYGLNQIGILRGKGNGTFQAVAVYATGTGPEWLLAGDFNADGNPDLATANLQASSASLLLGNGNGTLQPQTSQVVGTNPAFLAGGDFNGDGTTDLAVVNYASNNVSILLNQVTDTASASFTAISVPGNGSLHQVDAMFSADSNFGASTSNKVALTSSRAATITTLSTSTSTPSYGQQVVLTASISPSLLGALVPSGSIVFKDGTTIIGTAPLTSGTAMLNVTSLNVGTHSIIASYAGDANFLTSGSTAMSVVVSPATPVISWANPSAIAYGTLVGSAQFDATASVPGTFSYSPATYTLLTVGTHTLNAVFTPASSNYTTTSANVNLVVMPATPQITWATPAPITYPTPLSAIQLNATVAVNTIVPLASAYNVYGIYTDGSTYTTGGFDGGASSYSANQLGTSLTLNNITYPLGPANAPDAVSNTTIPLTPGYYASLTMLGALVNNAQAANTFIVNYSDGSSTSVTQSLSDWVYPLNWPGETEVKCVPYRNESNGAQDAHLTCVFAYSIPLDSTKIPVSLTMPTTRNVVMLAMALVSPPVPGGLVYTPPSGTVLPTGLNTLTATFSPTDQTNFTGATASVQELDNPANLTSIYWPPPASIVYGTPLSGTQLNAVARTTPGTTSVSLASYYRVNAFQSDGSVFSTGGFDNSGNAYSSNLLGSSITWLGQTYGLGPANLPSAVTSTNIALPQGTFAQLSMIGAATTTGQTGQTFVVAYTDGTTATTTLSLSSWTQSGGYAGEAIVSTTAYRNNGAGGQVAGNVNLYGYLIPLDVSKTVQSITLPNNRNVVIVAMALNTSSNPTLIPGSYTYTPPAGTVLPVGTSTLNVQFTPTNSNYGSAVGSTTIAVTKQALTVTSNSETTVFGSLAPAYSYTISGFVGTDSQANSTTGTPTLTTIPAVPTVAGVYPITAAIGSLTSTNYSFTFISSGALTITKAIPAVTWSTPTSIPYGTALTTGNAGQLNASSTVVGSYSYSPAAGTILGAGSHTLSVTFTPNDTTDYLPVTTTVQLLVTSRNLIVTANNATVSYGSAVPPYAYSIGGFVNGETQATATTGAPMLSTDPVTPNAVGSYPITSAAGTLTAANYTFSFAAGTLTITKATLTVTASSQSVTYGTPLAPYAYTIAGFVNGDTQATATAGTPALTTNPANPTAAGNYLVTASLGTLVSNNYTFNFAVGSASITKATLTVAAASQSVTYGTPLAPYAYTITGFAYGDTQATATTGNPTLTTTPATPKSVGSYPVTAALGTLASNNYSFNFVSGSITVNKAPLSVTATSASRAYNTPNPSFTGTITGEVNGDSFTESFSTTAVVSSPAGTYPITPTAAGPALSNYTVTLSPGTLTVTPASTSSAITWTPAALTYGTGLGAGQLNASSSIPGSFRYNQASGTELAAGTQTLTAVFTPADPVNYASQNVSAALTVNKAPLSVTATSASRAYNTANPSFTGTITGGVNG
ncbi:MAG: FG-GAP-like repeat-containing protein, partial [Acidobacteriota bacterium]|nr:FG-GAP-like repeat-containing protein [Acidobacteriota bacterium]